MNTINNELLTCSGYWTRTVAMLFLHSQAQYPYNAFVRSTPSCFCKCIITTICLSRLS
nr:MAG TPA: hypothetical protein [Crassvirales sp.]